MLGGAGGRTPSQTNACCCMEMLLSNGAPIDTRRAHPSGPQVASPEHPAPRPAHRATLQCGSPTSNTPGTAADPAIRAAS
ncbi:hypothetical protein GCM10010435_95580 [Winogradskya consettensis]|uniref:Uncharacterized protein n=1 Tax=Winogradskya consettensis TaxID=113560 RepID=A0A919T3D4_9ACTN|nr:hypothetical protein Aco04nite_90900 [Actinoplanes consettensis]